MTEMRALLLAAAILAIVPAICGQNANQANYDESKVGSYTLPDPLVTSNGTRITDRRAWRTRRTELLKTFASQVYGRTPDQAVAMRGRLRFEVTSQTSRALGGIASRQEITLQLTANSSTPSMKVLLYLPNNRSGRRPVFLGMNFNGNHAVTDDPEVTIASGWMRNSSDGRVAGNRATERSRGIEASRWPLRKIVEAGFGVATVYYGDLFPDHKDGWNDSVASRYLRTGQTTPDDDEWGALGAWAWGMSRALDLLQKLPGVDPDRVILHGHSRLGKAALWAGAQDERFAIVIANNSGEGGAALARRNFGETVERLNTAFPHWFCRNFRQYSQRVDSLPVDQHELIAMIAPRPVYIASAAEDLWADPQGEFLAARAAGPVYQLLGKTGLDTTEMPPIHQPIMRTIGYHIRAGKHDVTDYDWNQFINFANLHLPPQPDRK